MQAAPAPRSARRDSARQSAKRQDLQEPSACARSKRRARHTGPRSPRTLKFPSLKGYTTAMFDSLTTRLTRVLKTLRGEARISEDNVKDALREVRMALLEADVALPVVRHFVA